METMKAMPSGVNKRPSMPDMREQRQEHEHDDGGGVEDARAHLDGGRRHDLLDRYAGRGPPRGAMQAEAAIDVLDVDHGIVHQRTDGDGEAAERHGVERQPHRP